MLQRLFDTFVLASSLQDLRASKLRVARTKLDKVLSRSQEHFDFIFAFDALMMVLEDHHDEAKNRFKECLERLPSERNADEEYISLFCKFHLSSYENSNHLEEMRNRALELNARKTVRRFLRFPSPTGIQELQRTSS